MFRLPFFGEGTQPQLAPTGPPTDLIDLQETRSASIDISDIIEEYDETSEKSSIVENENTCTYFSLGRTLENDTSSFHTALQDGFTLNRIESCFRLDQEFNWSSNERDKMIDLQDFEVSWSDVVYKIPLTSSIGRFRSKCKNIVDNLSANALSCVRFSKRLVCRRDYPKDEFATILDGIGGSFRSSELTGIIGPSGAGKTSLLNFIARRREVGYSGTLDLNPDNRPLRISAIPQNHQLPEYLSVRENLLIASQLNNPADDCDHDQHIAKVVKLLDLESCIDTRAAKISGGQTKRVAIAQELLSKADIIILDEPTSGLDSRTCFKTLSVFRTLISSSRQKYVKPIAIVLTIHQPEQQAFDLFDKIFVIAHGGVVIYEGLPSQCVQYVKQHTGLDPPSQDYDPASFMIELASGEYGDEVIRVLSRQVKLDSQSKRNRKVMSSSSLDPKPSHISIRPDKDGPKNEAYQISKSNSSQTELDNKPTLQINQSLLKGDACARGYMRKRIPVLVRRNWYLMSRDPKQLAARIFLHLSLPLAIGYMAGIEPGHANACPKYEQNFDLKTLIEDASLTGQQIQNELGLSHENVGTLFIMIYTIVTSTIACGTFMFAQDMQISLKEYQNGWFSMESYIISGFLTSLPINFTLPPLCVIMTYLSTDQYTGCGTISDVHRILLTSVGLTLATLIGELFAMIFGALYVGHLSAALFASQGATLPFVIVSGFVVRLKNVPKFIYLVSWTSLYRHVLNITFIARYGYRVCECNPKRFNSDGPRIVGVPQKLRNFMKYMIESQGDSEVDANSNAANLTGIGLEDDSDLFDLVAKQVSFFNTYGFNVRSCEQVVPYQLADFGLTERDLIVSFGALIVIFVTMMVLLFITVKLVVRHKTSL